MSPQYRCWGCKKRFYGYGEDGKQVWMTCECGNLECVCKNCFLGNASQAALRHKPDDWVEHVMKPTQQNPHAQALTTDRWRRAIAAATTPEEPIVRVTGAHVHFLARVNIPC